MNKNKLYNLFSKLNLTRDQRNDLVGLHNSVEVGNDNITSNDYVEFFRITYGVTYDSRYNYLPTSVSIDKTNFDVFNNNFNKNII